ncbi:Gti1/Pac2 family-domain-containing protein [Syncephalastrum racemosum]|uniref:Gti1/Pac2 family-domain-containing protein n=1 Tax=Syncephalastrum racemosum TaxID=13706 RepID=A0A1X2HW01_SYNRA|nr:Gti1/Pac2 family-domain-containing protein [Syncephalastrum racemosum]
MMETYIGHIKTPQDALTLFEACRRGQLNRVQRRLSSKERVHIRSGSVFAWDEREAGMRRWTDGRTWSPSRVLGSFLTYRELDTKRRPRRSLGSKNAPAYSYKPDGLIKQSFSICTANNQKLHLISYYTKADILSGRLVQPTLDCRFEHIQVPKGLYPELNPLETSGGHSAALHSMRRNTQQHSQQEPQTSPSPPSLSNSPLSSDEDLCNDLPSPQFSDPSSKLHRSLPWPSPPPGQSQEHKHHKQQQTAALQRYPFEQHADPPSFFSSSPFQPPSPVCSNVPTQVSTLLIPSCAVASSSEDHRQLQALQGQLRL